jgi:hypothetical protein
VALAEASAVVEHRRKLVCDSETIAAIESRLFVQERVVKVSQLDEMMGTPERQVGRILRRKSRW